MNRSAFALFLLAPLAACQQASLEVKDVWARDTIGGTGAAAVYMTITSPTADRLTGASSPAAAKTDLMTMTGGNGKPMGMDYVKGIDIPAGTAVSLNPKGLHIWLEDLKQPLKAGESVQLTLKFEKAGERQVSVQIVAADAEMPM